MTFYPVIPVKRVFSSETSHDKSWDLWWSSLFTKLNKVKCWGRLLSPRSWLVYFGCLLIWIWEELCGTGMSEVQSGRNKRRHIHLLLLLLPEDFSIIFLLSTFAWESWLWLSFHEIKHYIWCLFQNSDFDTASSCDLGLERCLAVCSFLLLSDRGTADLCQTMWVKKKKKQLLAVVSVYLRP